MDFDVIFAAVVSVLAAVAVIGALVFAITWEVCAIRRTLADHRRRTMPPTSSRYWPEHSAVRVVDRIAEPMP
jgi:hypothetical protein